MRRRHRQSHRLIWPLLAAAVLLLAAAALMVRPPANDPQRMPGSEMHR